MNANTKDNFYLIIWIMALIAIGGAIGFVTKPEVNTWYSALNRAPLTPPNYVFPIAWTILYGIIGACGWLIWRTVPSLKITFIKILYVTQLVLNWSWTPVFFSYHLTGLALIILVCMDILVGTIIMLCSRRVKLISVLMAPYLLWLLFATYLNIYIWWYNNM